MHVIMKMLAGTLSASEKDSSLNEELRSIKVSTGNVFILCFPECQSMPSKAVRGTSFAFQLLGHPTLLPAILLTILFA